MKYSKLEVLVDFGQNPDEENLEQTLNHLKSQDGVKSVSFERSAIVVETLLPSTDILDMVKKTSGKKAVLQGFGETQSAVAMVSGQQCGVLGVVRLQQAGDTLLLDGSIDGLGPGRHGLHVHASGDLTQGCNSIGEHYNPRGTCHGGPEDPPELRHAGDLGNIEADERGRARFRITDNVLKLWDIIGRSIAVTERCDDLGRGRQRDSLTTGNSGRPVACGVIARSAGVFENPKRICQCDGIVVWEEEGRPLAGKGRRDKCCQDKEKQEKRCCQTNEVESANGVEH